MKKKPTPADETPVVDPELLDGAALPATAEKGKSSARCSVCGGETAPTSTEGLCWVCRRLKISAWRDSDQTLSPQE